MKIYKANFRIYGKHCKINIVLWVDESFVGGVRKDKQRQGAGNKTLVKSL